MLLLVLYFCTVWIYEVLSLQVLRHCCFNAVMLLMSLLPYKCVFMCLGHLVGPPVSRKLFTPAILTSLFLVNQKSLFYRRPHKVESQSLYSSGMTWKIEKKTVGNWWVDMYSSALIAGELYSNVLHYIAHNRLIICFCHFITAVCCWMMERTIQWKTSQTLLTQQHRRPRPRIDRL